MNSFENKLFTFAITLFVIIPSDLRGQSSPPGYRDYLEHVFCQRGELFFQKNLFLLLTDHERQKYLRTKLKFNDGENMSCCVQNDSFHITVGRTLISETISAGLMHEFSRFGGTDLDYVVYLFIKYRKTIGVVDAFEFIGLLQAQDSLLKKRDVRRNQLSFYNALFMYLHEIGHIMTNTAKPCTSITSIDSPNKESEIQADNWAIELLDRYWKKTHQTSTIEYLLYPFDYIFLVNDAPNTLSKTYLSELTRKLNLLTWFSKSYCPNNDTSAFCKYIQTKKDEIYIDTFFLSEKNYALQTYGSIEKRMFLQIDSACQQIERVISTSITNNYTVDSTFNVDRFLGAIVYTKGFPLAQQASFEHVADAYLFGNWYVAIDSSKALRIYEAISHIGLTSPYRWFIYDTHFKELYIYLESFNLITAILLQYKFKNIQKAIYYYTRAKQFRRLVPEAFYNNKIEYLKRTSLPSENYHEK
jgi:hypothetical protein